MTLVAPPVFAQPVSEKARADELLVSARKLLAAHSYAAACAKLAESAEADARVPTLMALGACFEKTGQTMSAWVEYGDAAKLAASLGDSREKAARQRVAALAPQLAKIKISVPPASAIPGLFIERDDEKVGPIVYDVEVPVDPGPHTVRASARGHHEWTLTVDVKARMVAVVPIPVLKEAGADAIAVVPTPAPPDPPSTRLTEVVPSAAAPDRALSPQTEAPKEAVREPRKEPTRASTKEQGSARAGNGIRPRTAIGLGLGGLGVLGVGLGSVMGILAKSDLDASNAGHCYGTTCDPSGKSLRASASGKALISTISFVGAGVALAAGATLLLTGSSAAPKVGSLFVSPNIGPGSAGVGVHAFW